MSEAKITSLARLKDEIEWWKQPIFYPANNACEREYARRFVDGLKLFLEGGTAEDD